MRTQKPDDRIYTLACDRLGVSPIESVFIDDIHANVEAARRLGMKGIVFNSVDGLRSELTKLRLIQEPRGASGTLGGDVRSRDEAGEE